jgi:hypothetical protein
MKFLYTFLCAFGIVTLVQPATAQTSWPKAIDAKGTNLKLYEWQPESFADNTLKARAAVSVITSGKTEPVFGMAWIKATTETNNNKVSVTSARITSLKLPEDVTEDQLDDIKQQIEQQIPSLDLSFRYDQLQQSLQLNTQQNQLSGEISNKAPKVIYSNMPAVLALIDGNPQFKKNDDWGVEAVVNTPFTIVKNKDGKIYLYGGKHWYSAPTVNGPYSLSTNVGSNLRKIEQAVQEANKDDNDETGMEKDENTIYKIIVSTEPAELIQSKGEANLGPVEGTSLLYVTNSDDDIFMDISSQQYYVLISGRWFQSKTLSGSWNYVPADNLPADFAKIPEGSPKDNVLASVAGTDAAQNALREAEVPQTAKVERDKARAEIDYDGDPEFEDIEGTDLAYAINTPASVLRWRGRYYSVDNGVWFESRYSNGPWSVAVERPYSVALIPARYPVYNLKYVYIYDVSPSYVYMGYTPGYLNAFIYGPTIVYGTGYYYRPWHRHFYYPRPCTWGYRVRYNPWYGWGFGFNYNSGWFHASIGFGNHNPWNYWSGGWWGPRYYRAPYCYRPVYHGRSYGYYNNRYYSNRSNVIVRANRTTNVYNYRRDVVTRDNQRYAPTYRYNNRRDYASNPNYNNINRPGRDNNNRGDNPRYNNNNNRSNRDYNNNRSNRSDYPTDRNRDINTRPNRTYNPGGNDNRNGGNNSRPGNNQGTNENRPGRTYSPGRPERTNTPGSAGNGGGRITTPGRSSTPGSSREPVRREYQRPGNSNPSNGSNREATRPGRTYERPNNSGSGRTNERSNSGGSGRTYTPPSRESNRQHAPVERRIERRESGSGGGSRSQGGGSRPQNSGGSSERNGGGGGRPSRS